MRTVLTASLLLILAAALIFSGGRKEEPAEQAIPPAAAGTDYPVIDDPVGREVSTHGVLGTLSGTIYTMKDEWFINDSGVSYEMHLGPIGHDNPDMFIDNSQGTARGFIFMDHISPITVDTSYGTFTFWREDRFPLWAGIEGGANRVEIQGERGIAQPMPQLHRTDGELGDPSDPPRHYVMHPDLFTGEIPDIDDPIGREVSAYGELGTLSGTIYFMNDEWFISDSGVSYEMHMGPIGHDNPDIFIDNSQGTARGFIYKDHISPIFVEAAGEIAEFWREDRFPIWAGSEGGANRVAVRGERGIFEPAPLFQRDAGSAD